MNILVLGIGMQGKAALHDLAASSEVDEIIAADVDFMMLEAYVENAGWRGRVRPEWLDAGDPERLKHLMQSGQDVVVDLLPPKYMARVAKEAVAGGVHLVNTVYWPAELDGLGREARDRGVAILPEFGLDPGIDLVMLGAAFRSLDTIEAVYSYGAGIPEPETADNPLRYKVSWTLDGVLNSYRRPARMILEGRLLEIESSQVFAPENIHEVTFAGLGELEAYPNGDAVGYVEALGLDPHSLRTAGRYSMRWPGHAAFWKSLADLHLLDEEPVIIDGAAVDRVRFLSTAIGPHIQYGPDERDLAIVRVEVVGTRSGERKRVRYELVDRRDLSTGLMAMSRTVGFTASIGAMLIGRGVISGHGLLSPLTNVPYDILAEELGRRGIEIVHEEAEL